MKKKIPILIIGILILLIVLGLGYWYFENSKIWWDSICIIVTFKVKK